jgi:hypothetical protein
MPLCGNKTIRFTDKDAAVLDFLAETTALYGKPPTYSWIALAFGIGKSAAIRRVRRLVTLGMVSVVPWKHRSIRIVRPSSRATGARPISSPPERV